ncbi:hypothetical protein [Tamaricihabitans halophyticus]|nr:hypothetical protein [Tamaricihabitans halophyticus]
MHYGEASLLCAQEAGTSESKAWTVQAKTARWQGRFAESADFAQRGFTSSNSDPIRIQLAYQEANAAALLGDVQRARQALQRAEGVADEQVQPPDDSGMSAWSFPLARQAVFALSVATHTGDHDAALRAAATADQCWAAGAPRVPATWAQVRLGAGLAHLLNGDLDGAAEQIRQVMDLDPELRVATVTGYTENVDRKLSEQYFRDSSIASELRRSIREFHFGAQA